MTMSPFHRVPCLRLLWSSVFGVFLTLVLSSSSLSQVNLARIVPTPDLYLDVKDLKVEFIAPKKMRVSGFVRGRGLSKIEKDNPASGVDIEVRVDFIRDDSTFSLIPTGWVGRDTRGSLAAIDKNPYLAHWYHQGKKYYQRNNKIPIFSTDFWVGPAIIDISLNEDADDGRWFRFDNTIDFDRILAKNRRRYRIIIGMTYDFTGGFSFPDAKGNKHTYPHFQEKYWWVVYGPFDWGSAPVCASLLTARHKNPVSFTVKGLEITDVEVLDEGTGQPEMKVADEPPGVKKKRPELVRPSKRPSQIEAVEAADKLQIKLNAMPGVTGSTVGLPPFAALLNISYAGIQEPEALTTLVSDIAVEAAGAAPWVESVRINLNGNMANSMVVISWDAVASFVDDKMTFEEFFQKWKIEGDPLPAPKSKK